MSIDIITMSTTSMCMRTSIRQANRTRIGTGTPSLCIVIPIIPTCITGMDIAMPDGKCGAK